MALTGERIAMTDMVLLVFPAIFISTVGGGWSQTFALKMFFSCPLRGGGRYFQFPVESPRCFLIFRLLRSITSQESVRSPADGPPQCRLPSQKTDLLLKEPFPLPKAKHCNEHLLLQGHTFLKSRSRFQKVSMAKGLGRHSYVSHRHSPLFGGRHPVEILERVYFELVFSRFSAAACHVWAKLTKNRS